MKPTRRDLRSFGLLWMAVIGGYFGLISPFIHKEPFPLWPWLAAAVLAVVSVIFFPLLTVPYRLWMRIAQILGFVNLRVILGLVFFVLITPISLIMRTFGYDPLLLKRDGLAATYRIASVSQSNKSMEDPF